MFYFASCLFETLESIPRVSLCRSLAAGIGTGMGEIFGRRTIFCGSLLAMFLGWSLLAASYAARLSSFVKVVLPALYSLG